MIKIVRLLLVLSPLFLMAMDDGPTATPTPTTTPPGGNYCPVNTPLPTPLSMRWLSQCGHCVETTTPTPADPFGIGLTPIATIPQGTVSPIELTPENQTATAAALTTTPASTSVMQGSGVRFNAIGPKYENRAVITTTQIDEFKFAAHFDYFSTGSSYATQLISFTIPRVSDPGEWEYMTICAYEAYPYMNDYVTPKVGVPAYIAQYEFVGTGIYEYEGWQCQDFRFYNQADDAIGIEIGGHRNATGALYNYENVYWFKSWNGKDNDFHPTPTPVSLCSSYEYSDETPLAGFGDITISFLGCFTVLPEISFSLPEVSVIGFSGLDVEIPGAEICVNQVEIPSLEMMGMSIPVELFILPLLAFLIRRIMQL